jgi:ferredoxin
LLKMGATFSKWRVRVTPNYCTQCRLCETSCPFGALRRPQSTPAEPRLLATDRRRLAWLLLLLPLITAGFGWLGWRFSGPASLLHPTVHLARRISLEHDSNISTGAQSPDALELQRGLQSPDQILAEATVIQQKFRLGATLFGVWVGVVTGVKLLSLSLRRRRTDYEPDRGECVACARCFSYCPNELARQGIVPAGLAPEGDGGTRLELPAKQFQA